MKKMQRVINRYLSLSQAARLAGVKRRTLQKRIQDGEILTFEGMLSLEELLKAYPQTEIEDNTMIEHSKYIKHAAYHKLLHESRDVPDVEVLSTRVAALSQELSEARSIARKYVEIVDSLKSRLDSLNTGTQALKELKTWLDDATEASRTDDAHASARLLANDTLLRLMTAHVRILPSGHDFFVEGTSNLLEAGLQAGLALNYACSNGNCGKCRARLVSGEIKQVQHHDYTLSEEQKATGHFLMCCNTPVNDVVIEAIEASNTRDIPQQQITTKIKNIEIKNDVALLHLRTPRTKRLRFFAGQYATLSNNNLAVKAEYSISSCPCDDMNLQFQIPRIAGDGFADTVFTGMKTGESIDIIGPHGEFILDEDSVRSLVFIAWHTGFAPIKSLIEHAMALDDAEHIHLFWVAASPEDHYLDNLCRAWQDALDNFHYYSIDADLSNDDSDTNRKVVESIYDQLDNPEDFDYYVAGREKLITTCSEIAKQRGIPLSQIIGDTLKHE